MLLEGILKLIL